MLNLILMYKKKKQDFAISEINNAVPIQNNQNENYEIELDDQQQTTQENISIVEQWNKQLNEWNEMLEQKEIIQTKDININDQMGFMRCFISNHKKPDFISL